MSDPNHTKVREWLGQAGRIDRMGTAIRLAFDWVIDGPRTGRYSVDQLQTSEKIYIGNRVEHETLHLLGLRKQEPLDALIEDVPVDVKFSLTNSWMIPPEAIGHLCLVITASDGTSTYRAGLVRITEDRLNPSSGNRDKKRGLSKAGRKTIDWFSAIQPLPKNFLLHLAPEVRDKILSHSGGQARVNELFRLCLNQIVATNAVDTIAVQRDPSKRIRDARQNLASEGIEIYGDRYDQAKVAAAGLPRLPKDSWISVKVRPT